MRLVSILIVVFALGLAGAVYIFAPRLLSSRLPPPQQPQVVAKLAASDVLVAAVDLPAGTVIKPEQVRWQGWPQDNLAPDFLVRDKGADPQKDVVGRIVLHGFEKGEPILPQRLLKPGEGGFLAAALAPGKRAVSIHIETVTGATGFILPGDYVDVLLIERYPVSAGPAAADTHGVPQVSVKDVTSVIMHNVKVLAINQMVQDLDSKDVDKFAGGTATLEVDLAQAEKLALAPQLGTLSLVLRSHTASSPPEREPGNAMVEDVQVSPFRAELAGRPPPSTAPPPPPVEIEPAQEGTGLRVYHGTMGPRGTDR